MFPSPKTAIFPNFFLSFFNIYLISCYISLSEVINSKKVNILNPSYNFTHPRYNFIWTTYNSTYYMGASPCRHLNWLAPFQHPLNKHPFPGKSTGDPLLKPHRRLGQAAVCSHLWYHHHAPEKAHHGRCPLAIPLGGCNTPLLPEKHPFIMCVCVWGQPLFLRDFRNL